MNCESSLNASGIDRFTPTIRTKKAENLPTLFLHPAPQIHIPPLLLGKQYVSHILYFMAIMSSLIKVIGLSNENQDRKKYVFT